MYVKIGGGKLCVSKIYVILTVEQKVLFWNNGGEEGRAVSRFRPYTGLFGLGVQSVNT